jgi:hypothetical protein
MTSFRYFFEIYYRKLILNYCIRLVSHAHIFELVGSTPLTGFNPVPCNPIATTVLKMPFKLPIRICLRLLASPPEFIVISYSSEFVI